MDLIRATVLANDEIMPSTQVIELESSELGRSAAPGQFIHIRPGPGWDPILRRPMSIYRIRPNGVALMVRSIGSGSAIIAASRPGDRLDCLGPLGRPFTVDRSARRLLMIGGGYGVAPLLALADAVIPREVEIVLLVGAANAEYVFPSRLVPSEVEYAVATVDGSLGHRGFVTELAPEYLDWCDAVHACGPTAMLEAVARLTGSGDATAGRRHLSTSSRFGGPVEVAMEQQMGCAMGVCLGCVVKTRGGYRRVCRDGPVFPAEELLWSELRWPATIEESA
jgi:dihydroorotate dehydrogenase electron transfer subunit